MPDFDLEQLVRAAKPEPAPAWVGRMDRRVEQRFPTPPRWWHWQRLRFHVLAAGSAASVLAVLVGIIALASQTGGGSDDAGTATSASSGSSSSKQSSPPQIEPTMGDSA